MDIHTNLAVFLNNSISGLIVGAIILILTFFWVPGYIASITPKPSVLISQTNNGNETVFYIQNSGNSPIPYLSLKISAPALAKVKIDNRSSINFRIFNGVLFNGVSIEAQNILPYDIGLVDIFSYGTNNAKLLNVSTDASGVFYLASEQTGLPYRCQKLTCSQGACGFTNITWLTQNLTGWQTNISCPPNLNYTRIWIIVNKSK